MKIEQVKLLTPFELEILQVLQRIAVALEDLKSDD